MNIESFKGEVPLLTLKQWEDMYPKNEYRKRKDFVLHFLIAHSNSYQSIKNYVMSLKEKNPEHLKHKDFKNHDLTPLHIAAMKCNTEVVELLFKDLEEKEKVSLINARDAFGWTPLHHAAVASQILYARFLKIGGDPHLRTKSFGDCNDYLALSGRVIEVRSKETLFIEDADQCLLASEVEDSIVKRVFGKNFLFTDTSRFSPLNFKELWQMTKEFEDVQKNYESMNILTSFNSLYENYRETPPKLVISPCKELMFSDYYFECKAKEKIPRGKIVSEYTGINIPKVNIYKFEEYFTEKNISSLEYFMEGFDASSVGNEARFFNCGFPNIMLFPIMLHGAQRIIAITLRDIEEGEALFYDYGIKMFHLTFGKQILFGKEQMISFFQEKASQIEEKPEKNSFFLKNSLDPILENYLFFGGVTFPLNNPTAIFYLHFSKILHYVYWEKNLFSSEFLFSWLNSYKDALPQILCIFETLKNIESFIEVRGEEYRAFIYAWVLEKLENQPLMHIIKGLDYISEKKEMKDIRAIIKETDSMLVVYDWMKDPFHSMNLDRRSRLMLNFFKNFPKDVKNSIVSQINNLPKESDSADILRNVLRNL